MMVVRKALVGKQEIKCGPEDPGKMKKVRCKLLQNAKCKKKPQRRLDEQLVLVLKEAPRRMEREGQVV